MRKQDSSTRDVKLKRRKVGTEDGFLPSPPRFMGFYLVFFIPYYLFARLFNRLRSHGVCTGYKAARLFIFFFVCFLFSSLLFFLSRGGSSRYTRALYQRRYRTIDGQDTRSRTFTKRFPIFVGHFFAFARFHEFYVPRRTKRGKQRRRGHG